MNWRLCVLLFVVGLFGGWMGVACDAGSSQASSFTQSECQKNLPLLPNSPDGADVAATADGEYIAVSYKLAPFRCAQKVSFYGEFNGDVLEVTARPVDLDPAAVAGCDCTYNLTGKFGPYPAGAYTVKIFHQGDNQSGQARKEVGSFQVTVTSGT